MPPRNSTAVLEHLFNILSVLRSEFYIMFVCYLLGLLGGISNRCYVLCVHYWQSRWEDNIKVDLRSLFRK